MKYRSRAASERIVAQEQELSCGAACARQLLLDAGVDVSEAQLREDAQLTLGTKPGILARPLASALQKHGGAGYFGGVADLDEPEMCVLIERRAPLLVLLGRHWVIVDRLEDGVACIRDPAPSGPGSQYGTEATLAQPDLMNAWQEGHWQAVWRWP